MRRTRLTAVSAGAGAADEADGGDAGTEVPLPAVAVGLGAPPLLAALTFGFFSSLNAATTHYGTGPAPIVFGAGYLTQTEWWRIGFLISLVHLAIWLPLGFLWWKAIGLW